MWHLHWRGPPQVCRLDSSAFRPLNVLYSEIRVAAFDMIFLRLLHLLAHHPDYALATEILQETAKSVFPSHGVVPVLIASFRYIEFYLDLIGTADNMPLLYHLAMKGKTVRDATSQTYSEVCRMACRLPRSS
jgi:sister-chromatid-cohesion protein PDS5